MSNGMLNSSSVLRAQGNESVFSGDGQLHGRLAQESRELESARSTLLRLRSTADFFRQRLQALLVRPAGLGGLGAGEHTSVVSRARDLLREMEAAVRAACEGSGELGTSLVASPALRACNYEALRHSLKESQRRSDSLNHEMVSQVDANAGLVETLGAVEDANKRLLEQIRSQTSEIGKLTQHRVSDAEQMEQISRRHELDHESVRQEIQHKAMALREAASERHGQVHRKLSDNLRHGRSQGDLVLGDTQRLRKDVRDRRQEFLELVSTTEGQMQNWDQEMLPRLQATQSLHRQRRADAEQEADELQSQFLAEREERFQENLDWGVEQGSFTCRRDELQARIQRECSQFSSRLLALEKRQLEERVVSAEERSRLECQVSDQASQISGRRAMLEQLQRNVVANDSAISSSALDVQAFDQATVELRRQARESDDALAAAVISNEHLREQMEEQRIRLLDKNGADLDDCVASYELRVQEERRLTDAELNLIVDQVQALEAEVQSCEMDGLRVDEDREAVDQDCTGLEADLALWRRQWDTANASRDGLEQALLDAKEQFHREAWARQAMSERLVTNSEDLQKEIRQIASQVQSRRRWIVSREAEIATRQSAADGQQREQQEMLASYRERLRDYAELRARAEEEATSNRQRLLEALSYLEESIDTQGQSASSDRERLEFMWESERHAHQQAEDDCNRQRELVTFSVRHARDENRQKLEGVERERSRVDDLCRGDTVQGTEYVGQQQQHVDRLEKDLARVRALLGESESNLGFLRQEALLEDRDGGRQLRDLGEEVHEASAALERGRREDAALVKQTEAQRFRTDQERQELRRGLDMAASTSPYPAEPVAHGANGWTC
ncbi:unnamed protein product [Polarella glacialis]|uniref:Uncharacterized protein n=1 Tax=Polarella glacialis TaxID=89957 RepID=A0A813KLQ5_POLGL|nr:unnamed protein product [Polarella glacialis]